MTCEDARPLVNAYVDRELDVVKSLEIEAHLNGCAACAREEASLRALHSMFGNSYSSLYHEAPARLPDGYPDSRDGRQPREILPGQDL